jgi:hypothetical protein
MMSIPKTALGWVRRQLSELTNSLRTSKLRLAFLILTVLSSALAVSYILTGDHGRWEQRTAAVWKPAPCYTVPYNCNQSELIIMGSVESKTPLSKSAGDTTYYNISLEVERTLKGPRFDKVVIMVMQGSKKLDWTYSPEIATGERLFLPALFELSDGWYSIGYECASEYFIWRIQGNQVYNKMGLMPRDPDTPTELRQQWQRTFSVEEFVSLIERSIEDPEKVRREIAGG